MLNKILYLILSFRRLRMSRDALHAYQMRKLKHLLMEASEHVDYYRDLFFRHNIKINTSTTDEELIALFKSIPVSSKDDYLASDVRKLISQKYALSELAVENTSGSSGQRFTVFLTQSELMKKNALRFRSWLSSGYNPFKKRVDCGTYYEGSTAFFGKFFLFRKMAIRVTVPPVEAIRVIEKYRPHCVTGYPGYLREVAEYARPESTVKVVILIGEMVDKSTRTLLEERFGADVREHYGAKEVGRIAFEDRFDRVMYVNEDNFIVETNDVGELIVTALEQDAMPFIRYNLGDLVVLEDADERYPFKRIRAIKGRQDDHLIGKGDKRYSPHIIASLVSEDKTVRAYQVHQRLRGKAQILLVVDSLFNIAIFEKLLRLHVPEVQFDIHLVERIERMPSGKFKAVINNVGGLTER
jgi:phenylacetate-CoA ligase